MLSDHSKTTKEDNLQNLLINSNSKMLILKCWINNVHVSRSNNLKMVEKCGVLLFMFYSMVNMFKAIINPYFRHFQQLS